MFYLFGDINTSGQEQGTVSLVSLTTIKKIKSFTFITVWIHFKRLKAYVKTSVCSHSYERFFKYGMFTYKEAVSGIRVVYIVDAVPSSAQC